MLRLISFFVLMVALLNSCKRNGAEDTTFVPSGNYQVVDVADGGTITGAVRIEGSVPIVPTLEINHDNDACGIAHPSPRFVASASGGLKYAVVYLEDIHSGAKLTIPEQQPAITQLGCAYEPHVSVVPMGTTVAVGNRDHNVLHNVHVLAGDTTVWNQAQPMFDQVNTHTFARPGLMTLRCDAGHTWMSGYIWVTEHPYYALTNDSGAFTLDHVPAGEYTLVCWHEGWNASPMRDQNNQLIGYRYDDPYVLRQKVTVAAKSTGTVSFVIPPHPQPAP